MKQILTFLTLTAVSFVVSPQQTDAQQYAWVPVVSHEPAATTLQNPTGDSTNMGESYATYVGDDLVPPPDDLGGSDDWDSGCSNGRGKGKGGCDCPACRHALLDNRTFGGAEYLQWWNQGRSLPPLISRGVVPPAQVLFGGGAVGEDLNSGIRLTVGRWLDDCENNALVVRGYGSAGARNFYNGVGAAGGPILATPFFDTFTAAPGALGVNVGGDAGTITSIASNDIYGGDAFFRTPLDQGCDYRVDLLGGYQFTRIDDDLVHSTTSNNPFTTNDYFDVSNYYNAAELGLLGEIYRGFMTLQFLGKCGVGNMRQTVGITGNSSLVGLPTPGGLFARTTNIGYYSRDVFAVSPEVGVKLIAAVRENISLSVGYTFLYWNRVALAGDQINTNINSQALFNGGGADTTPFTFRDTDFWVQTIDIGLTVNY